MNYSERLKNWCDITIQLFEWDIDKEEKDFKEKGSRRINADETIKKLVYKAKIESELFYGRHISSLYDYLFSKGTYSASFSDYINFSKLEHFKEEYIQEMFVYINHLKDLIDLYKDYEENDFNILLSKIKTENKNINSESKLKPIILEEIHNLVEENKINTFLYRDTGERIFMNDSFFISSEICFSKDLTKWLNHISSQSEFLNSKSKNEVYVTLFGKIDETNDIYSNFIITLHKGNTIWLSTDQVFVDNPHQKKARLSRAGLYRERDEYFDSCNLPFRFFDNLEEIRKNEKSISTKKLERLKLDFDRWIKPNEFKEFIYKFLSENNIEFTSVDIDYKYFLTLDVYSITVKNNGVLTAVYDSKTSEIIRVEGDEFLFEKYENLYDEEKLFLIFLVNEIIQSLHVEPERKTVMISSEFINQKLLEDKTYNPKEETRMTYWKDNHKAIFNELIETLDDINPENKTTALALKKYDLVQKSKHYNISWLTTIDKQESLAEWIILEEEREKIQKEVNKLSSMREEGYKWLEKMYEEKFDKVLNFCSQALSIEFYTDSFDTFSTKSERRKTWGGSESQKGKTTGVDRFRGIGFGKTKDWSYPTRCKCCNNDNSQSLFSIRIKHYKELMIVLGFDNRNKLHPYFRNYRSHNFKPYSGNSILDQTHPYLRVEDPLSDREPNGFSMSLFICARCYNKLKITEEKKEIFYTNI